MSKELKIQIKSTKVVFTGSIEAEHPLEVDSNKIAIKLSNGINLHFEHDGHYDIWRIAKSNLDKMDGKAFTVISSHEYGHNDEVVFNHPVSTVHVCINGLGLKMYGDPIMSKDQKELYENLVRYLNERGVICVDEIKKDVKLLITGNYKFPQENGQG